MQQACNGHNSGPFSCNTPRETGRIWAYWRGLDLCLRFAPLPATQGKDPPSWDIEIASGGASQAENAGSIPVARLVGLRRSGGMKSLMADRPDSAQRRHCAPDVPQRAPNTYVVGRRHCGRSALDAHVSSMPEQIPERQRSGMGSTRRVLYRQAVESSTETASLVIKRRTWLQDAVRVYKVIVDDAVIGSIGPVEQRPLRCNRASTLLASRCQPRADLRVRPFH